MRLDRAVFRDDNDGSHAAVWAGVNERGNGAWVQGGVMIESYDDQPFAYIEVMPHQRDDRSFRRWPVKFGDKVTVRLRRRGGAWSVAVTYPREILPHVVERATKRSSEVRIGGTPVVDATLELLGRVAAAGHIGSRRVRGRGA